MVQVYLLSMQPIDQKKMIDFPAKNDKIITLWGKELFHVLIEKHEEGCTCSYCSDWGKGKLHYGLNMPKLYKSPTSWWVIKYGKGSYLRWTNSFLRKS